MHVEILPNPSAGIMQFRIIPALRAIEDPASLLPRVVIVFATIPDASSALNLARALVTPNIGIWLVCPVTRSIFGCFRVSRFVRLAKTLACELEPEAFRKLRTK